MLEVLGFIRVSLGTYNNQAAAVIVNAFSERDMVVSPCVFGISGPYLPSGLRGFGPVKRARAVRAKPLGDKKGFSVVNSSIGDPEYPYLTPCSCSEMLSWNSQSMRPWRVPMVCSAVDSLTFNRSGY